MNGQNKSTGSESDTIHELRKQYNDLKKKFGDLKEINEELKEEIGMLRRPRWLDDLKRDAALRNDVFTFAWYQFSQRELSEIVDAKSLWLSFKIAERNSVIFKVTRPRRAALKVV